MIHIIPNFEQPDDIAVYIPHVFEPLKLPIGTEQEVEAVLAYNEVGHGYKFLISIRSDPRQDAEWQSTRDFINIMEDGSVMVTEAFQQYIRKDNILLQNH